MTRFREKGREGGTKACMQRERRRGRTRRRKRRKAGENIHEQEKTLRATDERNEDG